MQAQHTEKTKSGKTSAPPGAPGGIEERVDKGEVVLEAMVVANTSHIQTRKGKVDTGAGAHSEHEVERKEK